MRVHTGGKVFIYKKYENKFSQRSTLTCHIRVHSVKKPFNCKDYRKIFSRRNDFSCHMRSGANTKDKYTKLREITPQNIQEFIMMEAHIAQSVPSTALPMRIAWRNFLLIVAL
jgi:uncharacterized Zn-finger protein